MTRFALGAALGSAMILTACGGGGNNAPTKASIIAGLEASQVALELLDPTPIDDMPTVDTATYSGQAIFWDADGPNPTVPEDADFFATVSATADFGAGEVDGSITNFRNSGDQAIQGSMDFDGADIIDNEFGGAVTGTLSAGGVDIEQQGLVSGDFLGPDAGAIAATMIVSQVFEGDVLSNLEGGFVAD